MNRAGRPAKSSAHVFGWLLVGLAWVTALAVVLIPVWLIQPFRPQTPGAVALSHVLRAWSPLVTLVALATTLFLGIALWRRSRRWIPKAFLVIATMGIAAAAWLARQNHFEWMFNPLPDPGFARAADATFVAGTDMVLTVEINGDAAAYPVRQLAYHHLVQDIVGGVPIVATY